MVDRSAKLDLRNLTIADGAGIPFGPGSVRRVGGGIANFGTLAVTNGILSGNSVSVAPTDCCFTRGGGIYNDGTLTVMNSTFSDNSADRGSGGGIGNGGELTVTNSTFSGNSAQSQGGGIQSDSTTQVMNSTFSGNSVDFGRGGGISNQGTLTVMNSTFSGNSVGNAPLFCGSGGGISNNFLSMATVTHSTFSGNSADCGDGGGIYNDGELTLGKTILANSPNGGNCFFHDFFPSARVTDRVTTSRTPTPAASLGLLAPSPTPTPSLTPMAFQITEVPPKPFPSSQIARL